MFRRHLHHTDTADRARTQGAVAGGLDAGQDVRLGLPQKGVIDPKGFAEHQGQKTAETGYHQRVRGSRRLRADRLGT